MFLIKKIEKLKGKNVLVTGGFGFIGSHLVKTIKPLYNVTVLSHTKNLEGVKSINVDLRDEKDVLEKIKDLDFDIVFHMAGRIKLPGEDDYVKEYFEVNATGTKNILEACRRKDIERFIYSSSMSVFGNVLYLPVNEEHPKMPRSFYGMSKLLGEIYCDEFHRLYGISTTILRYSAVFGPGQNEKWVIPIFISKALKKEPLQVENISSGDFVYVKDVVNANILAACEKCAAGEDFNIGSGRETTMEELACAIKKIISDTKIIYISTKNQIIKRFVFDISKARNVLGYTPNYSLIDGLVEQIKYAKHAKSF